MAGELVERLNWWAAKRKPPKGMETLPADCREAADRIEALERENATLRAALGPFALAVERAEKAATALGVSHRAEVPDNRDFGPLVVTWGDLRRAAAIRNTGGEG